MTITISREHYRAFDDFARKRHGLRYGYGGAFRVDPAYSTDCSGLVLQSAAFLRGRTDWSGNRYGSTESFRLDYKIVYDLGFRRLPRGGVGALSFKPIMLVGLQHGGGGIYSHTACTVYGTDRPGGPIVDSKRGVDWESQGAGVFYYDGARAWNNSLFHDFWYLDAKLAPVAPPVIINEINAEAGREPWLGKRKFDGERACLDGVGRYVDYEHGSIYWHPSKAKTAVAVPAEIYAEWKTVSWEQGPLGYPVADVKKFSDGLAQEFQGGWIYKQQDLPAVVIHGAILQRYLAVGGPSGWGYPLGKEKPTTDGGREQAFSKGVTAVWHPSGVVTVKGAA